MTCGWLKFWKGGKERKWKKKKKTRKCVTRRRSSDQKTWIKVRTYPPAPTQHLRPCSAIAILTSNMSARSFFKFSVSKWKTTVMTHIKALPNITSPFFILLHIFCGCYVQAKFLWLIALKWRRVNISKIIMFKRSSQSGL